MCQTCPKPFTGFNSFNLHSKPYNYPRVRDKKVCGKCSSWLLLSGGSVFEPREPGFQTHAFNHRAVQEKYVHSRGRCIS